MNDILEARLADLRRSGRLVKRTLPDGSEVELVEKSFRFCEERAYDAESHTVRVVASDETVDRYGDVIEVAGWDLANFRRNPVILLDHNYSVAAIAGRAEVQVANGALVADITLGDIDVDQAARLAHQKLQSGLLRAVSVGFYPKAWKAIRDDDDNWTGGYRFTEQELLEISWVAVPANPSALVTDSMTQNGSSDAERLRAVRALRTEQEIYTAVHSAR